VVRQRETSPGLPGCWAMLVKDRPAEMTARTPRVAARMKRLRPMLLVQGYSPRRGNTGVSPLRFASVEMTVLGG